MKGKVYRNLNERNNFDFRHNEKRTLNFTKEILEHCNAIRKKKVDIITNDPYMTLNSGAKTSNNFYNF